MNPATMAGVASTVMFLVSHLPMVVKATRSRDLDSYSRGNLVLVNAGNALYTLYVVSLPVGPVWLLHSVYTGVSAFMLLAHVLWAPTGATSGATDPVHRLDTPDAGAHVDSLLTT